MSKRTSCQALRFAGSVAAALVVTPALALSISVSNSNPVVVDATTDVRSVTVTAADVGAINSIEKLLVTLDFIKCGGFGDSLSAPLPSACSSSDPAYAREISFSLTDPAGTVVHLVTADTYFGDGPAPGGRITVTFDDAAADVVGYSIPAFVSGSFRPVGQLADFIGDAAIGTWILSIGDDGVDAPLGLASFSLDMTLIPEPESVALLGLGLASLGMHRKRDMARWLEPINKRRY